MVNNFGINSVMSDTLTWLGNKLNFWELKSELCEKHVQHWRLNVLFLDWEHLNVVNIANCCSFLLPSCFCLFLSDSFLLWRFSPHLSQIREKLFSLQNPSFYGLTTKCSGSAQSWWCWSAMQSSDDGCSQSCLHKSPDFHRKIESY